VVFVVTDSLGLKGDFIISSVVFNKGCSLC